MSGASSDTFVFEEYEGRRPASKVRLRRTKTATPEELKTPQWCACISYTLLVLMSRRHQQRALNTARAQACRAKAAAEVTAAKHRLDELDTKRRSLLSEAQALQSHKELLLSLLQSLA